MLAFSLTSIDVLDNEDATKLFAIVETDRRRRQTEPDFGTVRSAQTHFFRMSGLPCTYGSHKRKMCSFDPFATRIKCFPSFIGPNHILLEVEADELLRSGIRIQYSPGAGL